MSESRGLTKFIGCQLPSVHSALLPSMIGSPSPLRSPSGSSRRSSASGSGMVSSSISHNQSQPCSVARFMPSWNPPAPPSFRCISRSSTCG